MKILVLNAGSSSLKCWYDTLTGDLPVKAPKPLWHARVDWSAGSAQAKITTRDGVASSSAWQSPTLADTVPVLLESLWSGDTRVIEGPGEIDMVGHRVVHGGPALREPTLLTADVRATIAGEDCLAPIHNQSALAVIDQVDRVLGTRVPQAAVFDTGFHATLRPAAYVYPGPYQWLNRGIRRYGFHGISHQYASRRAAQLLGKSGRFVICHLGSGCSLCAVRDGVSVNTSMGFTPLDGIAMATRSGSVDPGILIYLERSSGCSAGDLDRILNHESGLYGISGISADMRKILEAMTAGNERARLAFDVYTHRLCEGIGAMAATLGGLDALVFTGGVGENCVPLWERVCRQFAFLGVRLADGVSVSAADRNLAGSDSPAVLIVHAQEEWEIARECYRFIPSNAAGSP